MSNRIEQLVDEIETYIDECKFQPLSSTKIVVVKDEIDELLSELRRKMPDEIKHYQKIINNKEAILSDARQKAEILINDATVHTNELINEHEIMQQAYAQANEVVTLATNQAQGILDNAAMEANNMRMAAMQYTDDMLAHVENVIASAMESTSFKYEELMNSLKGYYDVVVSNRSELYPEVELENEEFKSEVEE